MSKAAWKALGAPRRAAPGQHEQLRRFPREVAISGSYGYGYVYVTVWPCDHRSVDSQARKQCKWIA